MASAKNEKGEKNVKMEAIVSLCKRRGFIYQGSEVYGGLAGTWDYGPLGVALKNNIKALWWKRFVDDRDDMYGVDAAILMNQNVWKASGHVAGFADPMIECLSCKSRFREDSMFAGYAQAFEVKRTVDDFGKVRYHYADAHCPICLKLGNFSEAKQFNMMFKTHAGAVQDETSVSYLRPETAQGMFVNFKNIVDSFHPKLPFGLAQIGKAFRNEIAPRDFTFRSREFEQMEIEYFVRPEAWKPVFEGFVKEMHSYMHDIGLEAKHVHELEIADGDRAHYSKRTIDFEFDYPFGRKELYGLAYRTDFDLKAHTYMSKVDLSYYDEETKERFIPHCIEPSFGVDRTVLAVLSDAYTEDELASGEGEKEKRVFLKFSPKVAPTLVAVFPLLKNKPALIVKAQEIYKMLKKELAVVVAGGGRVAFDDNGNIGKRYRRQDEVGTPFCVTVDFETVEKNNGVTVRDRDTGEQVRIKIEDLVAHLTKAL